jgi:hypothetical protein
MSLSARRLAQSRAWAEKNRERKRELYREWVQKNPERRKEIDAKYRDREDRRAKARETSAKWREDNPIWVKVNNLDNYLQRKAARS